MPNPVIDWGASGHAAVVADTVQLHGQYEIAGFIDALWPERAGMSFCGSQILCTRASLPTRRAAGLDEIIIAVGDCSVRLKLANTAKAHDFHPITALHPSSIIAKDSVLGPGDVGRCRCRRKSVRSRRGERRVKHLL